VVVPEVVVPQNEYDRRTEAVAWNKLRIVTEAALSAGVPCRTLHIRHRDPYVAILDAADKAVCDLIVMGSHGCHGLTELLLGSERQPRCSPIAGSLCWCIVGADRRACAGRSAQGSGALRSSRCFTMSKNDACSSAGKAHTVPRPEKARIRAIGVNKRASVAGPCADAVALLHVRVRVIGFGAPRAAPRHRPARARS
jgi:hypothetical protein